MNRISTPKTVTVRAGDTLESLAHSAYGDVSKFRDIADENNLDIFSSSAVTPGTALIIPALSKGKVEVRSRLKALKSESFDSDLSRRLDLSGIKQPQTANVYQVFSWVL